jgi:hypothetical protein
MCAKKSTKRKVRSKTMPVLGVAGITFSLLTGGSAALAHPSLEQPSAGHSHDVVLKDEEVSDVSLATFYAFDREDQGGVPRLRLAAGISCAACATCAGACAWGGNYYGYGPPPVYNQAYPSYVPAQKYQRGRKRRDDAW